MSLVIFHVARVPVIRSNLTARNVVKNSRQHDGSFFISRDLLFILGNPLMFSIVRNITPLGGWIWFKSAYNKSDFARLLEEEKE